MPVTKDRERSQLERRLFEAYASLRGYSLKRAHNSKYDVSRPSYRDSVVNAEWRGWLARAAVGISFHANVIDVLISQGGDVRVIVQIEQKGDGLAITEARSQEVIRRALVDDRDSARPTHVVEL